MKPVQRSLLPKPSLEHGGAVRRGRRKTMRPIDPRRPVHVVLRSSRARGPWSFLNPTHKGRIHVLIESEAERLGVRIFRFANVGNHLHILLKPGSRSAFQSFLRSLSGRIAMLVTGARKGHPVGRFWDALAYSRVVSWGAEFRRVNDYLVKNLLEGLGTLDRRRDSLRWKLLFSAPPPG